jgi:hypothetical protein
MIVFEREMQIVENANESEKACCSISERRDSRSKVMTSRLSDPQKHSAAMHSIEAGTKIDGNA